MTKKNQTVQLRESATPPLKEAETIKARAKRMARELDAMLKDKDLPDDMRKQMENLRASLQKTWKELATGAALQTGRKGLTKAEGAETDQPETEGEEISEGDWYGYGYEPEYVPSSVTSFTQLQAAKAAEEMASDLRERAGQFQQMVRNILWSDAATVPDKPAAMRTLVDEFMLMIEDAFSGDGEGDAMAGGESTQAEETEEAEQFTESYEPTFSLVEAEGNTDRRGPLEMDVQIIQPGWGNSRDNHYYPAEMLKRDAAVFENAKMYLTDHRQDEKSVRTEVSQIKKIMGFTEAGAPIARVVVFDPGFAEQVRNRAAAGVLDSLECSILADGKAKSGFEQGGRKGKVVESITAVSSVDWVTRAGAGGKALGLVESADGSAAQEAPAENNAETAATETATTQPVTIREEDQQPPTETPAAPVFLGEAEIREALSKVNLPAASVLALVFGKYEAQQTLTDAIAAEVKRIKEVSGSGRPFGLGESSPVPSQPASRAKIEEVMDKVNSRFGIGRS